jgi:hypothetical protein
MLAKPKKEALRVLNLESCPQAKKIKATRPTKFNNLLKKKTKQH